MLAIEQLTKTFSSGKVAIADINFEIAPGSFTAILGSSGAGKTTLLRCILQLLKPDRGRVWLEGADLTRCSPSQLRSRRAKMAAIAQQYNLVRRRTALENCLGGRLRELPLWRCFLGQYPDRLLREGLAALDRVNLLDVAFQRADRLSGGQQQRVAIARALVQNASIILADEPVASLDPHTARVVLELLRSLCQREGLTVVCNLHQIELAREFSDRILGIREGRLALDLPTSQLSRADEMALYGTQQVVGSSAAITSGGRQAIEPI